MAQIGLQGSRVVALVRMRAAGEAMIRETDDLLCQSWNERMWADGEPVDPSLAVDQAINDGYPWLEIACSRCRSPRTVAPCIASTRANHLRA